MGLLFYSYLFSADGADMAMALEVSADLVAKVVQLQFMKDMYLVMI